MKNYKIVFAILLSLVIFAGCSKDWLDVNNDPNKTKSANPELVLPAGIVSMASNVGGYYNLIGGFWSQYWTQSNVANQYKDIDQYNMPEASYNRQWREMYAGALSDIQLTIDQSKAEENNSYVLMATVMKVYGFQLLVDLYNDVPYSEAFQGDAAVQNFNPKFDNGQDIYDDLIVKLDEALALEYNDLTDAQKTGDILFNGDIDQWVRFANTLKLKIYIHQMYARPSVAQSGIEALYASGAEFLDVDAAVKLYMNEENKDNPLYASNVRKLNVATNLRVSATLYMYLSANGDTRLSAFSGAGTTPLPQGGFNILTADLPPANIPVFVQAPTDPVYFISDLESYLLQAEAIAKGWGTGDDKALYDAAVTASFARYGEDASTYIGTGGVYEYPVAGTFEEKQEAIIMAKWAAFSGSQSMEMFFETNRTHYPAVSAVAVWANKAYNDAYVPGRLTYSLEGLTGGLFPKRLNYPQDEVNLNPNFPGQTLVTDKVWWDKK